MIVPTHIAAHPNAVTVLFGPIASGRSALLIELLAHTTIRPDIPARLFSASQAETTSFAHRARAYSLTTPAMHLRIAGDSRDSLDSLFKTLAAHDSPALDIIDTIDGPFPARVVNEHIRKAADLLGEHDTSPARATRAIIYTLTAESRAEALRRLRTLHNVRSAYYIDINNKTGARTLIALRAPRGPLPAPAPFTIDDNGITWNPPAATTASPATSPSPPRITPAQPNAMRPSADPPPKTLAPHQVPDPAPPGGGLTPLDVDLLEHSLDLDNPPVIIDDADDEDPSISPSTRILIRRIKRRLATPPPPDPNPPTDFPDSPSRCPNFASKSENRGPPRRSANSGPGADPGCCRNQRARVLVPRRCNHFIACA